MLTRSCKNPVNKFVKVNFVKLLILIKRVVVFVVFLSTLKNEFIGKSFCRIVMRKQGFDFCETLTLWLRGFCSDGKSLYTAIHNVSYPVFESTKILLKPVVKGFLLHVYMLVGSVASLNLLFDCCLSIFYVLS